MVVRGVPTYTWIWIAAVLLSIPPIVKMPVRLTSKPIAGNKVIITPGELPELTHNPIFLIYGLMLLGLTGVAEYRGWTFSRVNEQKCAA